MTIYAIGDIHGCLDALRNLLDRVAEDAVRLGVVRPRLVFTGDYIDRGPDSKGVLDLLSGGTLETRFDPVYLMGNHDEALLDVVRYALDHSSRPDLDWPGLFHDWVRVGGEQALASYGVGRGTPDARAASLLAAMPEAHRTFLGRLQPSWREDDLFFSHAGVDPDRSLDDQPWGALVYGDSELFEFDHEWMSPRLRESLGARVVHGHFTGKAVEIWDHRIAIDTGAGFDGGWLTAVAIDGNQVRVIT